MFEERSFSKCKQHGKLTDISIDFQTRKPKISILLDSNELTNIEELNGIKLNVELKKWYKKRSIDANAYCWVLCDKIAKKITTEDVVVTKEDVYKDAVLQIGSYEPFIVQESSYEKFKRIWEKQGLGFLVQEVSRKDKCIKVHCYYGSSTYDSKEMSLLIEWLIQEAKQHNIETKSRAELDSLIKSWGD